MRDWRILHKNHDGTNRGLLQPENLSFTMVKGEAGSHSVNYELDLGNAASVDMQQFTEPYRTDFELTVDGIAIIGGIHTEISFNTDDEFMQIAGKDWMHYFERREYPFDPLAPNAYRLGDPDRGLALAYENTDIGIVVNQLLVQTLSQPYSLPITWTTPTVGILVDYEISLADVGSIQSKLAELSQEQGGAFDFWVDTNMVLHFAISRQYDVGASTDPNECAMVFNNDNMIRGEVNSAGPGATRFVGYGAGNEVRLGLELIDEPLCNVYRRLDGNADFSDVPSRARVDSLTIGEFHYQKHAQDSVTIEVQAEEIPGFWNTMRPGIAVWVDEVPAGPVWINGAFEVMEVSGDVSTEGGETISLTLEPIHWIDVPDPPPVWSESAEYPPSRPATNPLPPWTAV